MADENTGGTSVGDAIDMAVGTAVAATLVNDNVDKPVDLAALPPNCLNCGAVVCGRFCVDCGQTTDTHVPTLGEVVGDTITSIFNLDSRLWRTFLQLFFSPGRLTQEFLAGRRARYVPPLRLYLVLSVLTFLIMSIDPRGNDNDDESGPRGNPLTQAQEDAIENASDEEREAVIQQIVNAQVDAALQDVPGVPADVAANARAAASRAPGADADDPDPDLDLSRGVDFSRDDNGDLTGGDARGNRAKVGEGFDCDKMDIPVVDRGNFVDSAVREACEEGKADNFDSIQDAFLDNIPLLAFMVIPVMAIVFKLFYIFTGRNYLAHLVFLCHTHAFTFLLIVVLTAMRFTGRAIPALSTPFSWIGGALFLVYSPVYYFLALRRVYQQGVMLTVLKQFVLMFVYLFATTLVFSVGFLVVMFIT